MNRPAGRTSLSHPPATFIAALGRHASCPRAGAAAAPDCGAPWVQPTLLDVYVDAPLACVLSLRRQALQNAVLVARADLGRVHCRGKREVPLEGAVEPLDMPVGLALVGLLRAPRDAQRQG